MIKLNVPRRYSITHEDGDNSFTIVWKFPYTTSDYFEELRSGFENKSKAAFSDQILMDSIESCSGVIDESTGEGIDISNKECKAALFDYIKSIPEYYVSVLSAYIGPKSKNLLAGLMPSLTGSGIPVNVDSASANVKQESASI